MYVCICNAVSEDDLKACIRKDCTYQTVCQTLGLSDKCGRCESLIKDRITKFTISTDPSYESQNNRSIQ